MSLFQNHSQFTICFNFNFATQRQGYEEYDGIIWDYNYNPPKEKKTKFRIKFTINQEIQYLREGQILRIDQIIDTSQQLKLLKNLEQIQNLQWFGDYGENNQKIGKWGVIWKGETLTNVGGWYRNAFYFQFQSNYTQIMEKKKDYGKNQLKIIGVKPKSMKLENIPMIKGNKAGSTSMKTKKCGEYNIQGEKNGKWIELSNLFWDFSQIFYQGIYKNGYKIGKWDTLYKWNDKFEQIGGGLYDEQNQQLCQVKIGKWIELSDKFNYNSQVIYNGLYNNGQKIGNWSYLYRKNDKFEQIGGGEYYQIEGRSMKNGIWIELNDDFKNDSLIIYKGDYINDKKIGRWNILYKSQEKEIFNQIGGGSYSQIDGNSFKNGKWIELNDGFKNDSLVIQNGEYKNNHKIGRWDILFKEDDKNKFKQIAGGSYDQVEGYSVKNGKWIELVDGFSKWSQVTYEGKYKNGKKVGRWDIFYKSFWNGKKEQIGGGLFDERDSIKIGRWIEESNTFYGQYLKGKKVGRWDIEFEGKQIGGGLYVDQIKGSSIKIGKWIELDDEYSSGIQVTLQGEYKNGKKVGLWDIFYKGVAEKEFKLIGGGHYQEQKNGGSIKIGRWIQMSYGFWNESRVTFIGEYKNGNKIGRWEIWYQKNYDDKKNELIGGGSYDQEYFNKIGIWIEPKHKFRSNSQVTYKGEYKNGKKIGRWEIWYQKNYGDKKNQLIGGGLYDEKNSIKIGRWVEISDGFQDYSQVTYNGEYQQGKKVGRWDILYNDFWKGNNQQIGGGEYDEENSNKIGKWIELSDEFECRQQVIYNGEYLNGKKNGKWMKRDLRWNEKWQELKYDN